MFLNTFGSNSYDAYGKTSGLSNLATDFFSATAYTGNGSSTTRDIPTGVDISTYGGLTFFKSRSAVNIPFWIDKNRGALYYLNSSSNGNFNSFTDLSNWNTTGVTLNSSATNLNPSAVTEILWSFRKGTKYFDIVQYNGNNTTQTINHSLGSTPGLIIIKALNNNTDWSVYHKSLTSGTELALNLNSTPSSNGYYATAPTSTTFTVTGGSSSSVNSNAVNYVAYLFASDAGGYGPSGTDSIVSCGTYTGNATLRTINCNFANGVRFLMIKNISGAGNWCMFDTTRGMTSSSNPLIYANLTAAEITGTTSVYTTPTGFQLLASPYVFINSNGQNYVYLAIA